MEQNILGDIVVKSQAAISNGTDLALVVGGAAGAAAILEVIRSWAPDQTADITDEVLAVVAGLVMLKYGERIDDRLVSVGLGVAITGAGGWSQEWVSGIISMLKKKE